MNCTACHVAIKAGDMVCIGKVSKGPYCHPTCTVTRMSRVGPVQEAYDDYGVLKFANPGQVPPVGPPMPPPAAPMFSPAPPTLFPNFCGACMIVLKGGDVVKLGAGSGFPYHGKCSAGFASSSDYLVIDTNGVLSLAPYYGQAVQEVYEEVVAKIKDFFSPKKNDRYPHICEKCKGPAYIGYTDIDCKAKCS